MRIRSLFTLGTVVWLGIAGVASVVLYTTFVSANEAFRRDSDTGIIKRSMVQLSLLTTDYLLSPGDRSAAQWKNTHAALGKLLESITADSGHPEPAVSEIVEDHERLARIFAKLANTHAENPGRGLAPGVEEARRERLVGQTLTTIHAMSSAAHRLSVESRLRVREGAFRVSVVIVVLMVVITLNIAASWWVLNRLVVAPVRRLREGIETLGGGDLGYRIGMEGSHEISDVARAFDQTVARLEEVTVSRDRLAVEVGNREKAEALARQSEERVRLLLYSTAEAIYGIDLSGRCIFANPACLNLLGYTMEDLLGRNMHALIHHTHPDGRKYEAAECHIYKAIRSGENVHVDDEVFFYADGSSFPAEYWSHPIRVDGSVNGAVVSFLDITERKRAASEIDQKNRDLESLLYVTSHDLREPLRAIENFSRMVHDRYAQALDAKGSDFLRRVVAAAQRMNNLLDDILQLSRAGRMETPAEHVEMSAVTHEVLERLEPKISSSGAAVNVADDLPAVRANRMWMTQAVYNLVLNALKFTCGDTPPDIEIAPFHESGTLGIVVRDRGPGIAPEHADRIFQLFQRAVGREVEGTGAGLAIVRQVAESHGGHAWARAREGGGSEFILTVGEGGKDNG